MRKTLSFVLMLLFSMATMAETVKIDFTKAPDEKSSSRVVWNVGNLKFIVSKEKSTHNANEYVNNNGLKMYKDQMMTIISTNETSIQKATFRDSPMEPGPTPPVFSALQNCTAEYGWDTVLKAESDSCTFMSGTLSEFSHIIWVEIETRNGGGNTETTDSIGGGNGGGNTEPTDSIGGGNGGGNTEPTDSIGGGNGGNGGGGDITPNDSIDNGGGGNSGDSLTVNSEAYRQMYLDFLNYYKTVKPHYTAFLLYLHVESECDRQDDKFETQEACDKLYAYLTEKFNIIREMVGDTPYNGTYYEPRHFSTDKLDALMLSAEEYYNAIHVKYPSKGYTLNDVMRDAMLSIYEINTQKDVEDIYAKLLEGYNEVRVSCGDKPYEEDEDGEPDSENPDYANLNSAIRRSEWFIEDLQADAKYADIMAELQDAVNEAKKALSSRKQSVIDAAAQALEDALLKAQNAKKEMDKEPVDPDEEGTPMEPIKPDLSQYTHKMMVLGAPWGINGLYMAILRDTEGRVVQKMTMHMDNLSAHLTDSVRTYAYEGNKMIEYLAVPHYDANDVLEMEPMGCTITSYYKLSNGHREVVQNAWYEDGEYRTGSWRDVYTYDNEGRKVSYKQYYGEELRANLTYTYDDKGGCLGRGLYDGYSNTSTYFRKDSNGNVTGNTEWGTYYEYFFDNKNHYLGSKYYYDYDFENGTYGSVNDRDFFETLETYADGSVKKIKRKGDGEVRTFSRSGNVETQINTPSGYGTQVTITRTFDDQGRIIAKTSTENTFKSYFVYSDLETEKVLGGVNIVDENLGTKYDEVINWASPNPLAASGYERTFWEFHKEANTTYNIVPLSVLPAQNTGAGVAISVGGEGDQVVFSNEGEIYLLDKGGKKRFSVSVGGINVSSDGGKIVVTGWTPISPASSVSGMRKAPRSIDLTTNEYDIFIPENTISINGKPLNDVYLPITMEESTEDDPDAIHEAKSDVMNAIHDGRIYNLQGMEVKNVGSGKIVIMNGKKVLVK